MNYSVFLKRASSSGAGIYLFFSKPQTIDEHLKVNTLNTNFNKNRVELAWESIKLSRQ